MPKDRGRIAVAMLISDLPVTLPKTIQLFHRRFMPADNYGRNDPASATSAAMREAGLLMTGERGFPPQLCPRNGGFARV